MKDGKKRVCVCVYEMGSWGSGQCALDEFVLQGRFLWHQGAFDWSFWLVAFNVPSADRTPSKVNKDSLFLSSLSPSRSVPVLTDDIGPCLWHLVYNAKLWCANDKVCWECAPTLYEVHMSWRVILKVHSVFFYLFIKLFCICCAGQLILTPSGMDPAVINRNMVKWEVWAVK